MARRTFIVAEAGVNHDGDVEKALDIINAAAEAGVNGVKFQTFIAERLVSSTAPVANYQKRNTGQNETQLSMLSKLQLSRDDHFIIAEHCRKRGVEFLSTAFDESSLNFLVSELGVRKLKIASGEITNGPFLLEHTKFDLDILLSTGMTNNTEIDKALGVLALGFQKEEVNAETDFENTDRSSEGWRKLERKVTLLQCTTQYPAPAEEANLRAMLAMGERYGLRIGYSWR